jgi:hypothetical protein
MNLGLIVHDVPKPSGDLADGSAAHIDVTTWAWDWAVGGSGTPLNVVHYTSLGGGGELYVPDFTPTASVQFDPSPFQADDADVELYAQDPGGNWFLFQAWEWNHGHTQTFLPPVGINRYELVSCADHYPITGSIHLDFDPQVTSPAFPPAMPDISLGFVDGSGAEFNQTLGLGGGSPLPVNLQPGLALQFVPRDIGFNHWQYLPLQGNFQADFTRPWLYVNNDPNQGLAGQTSVNVSLSQIADGLGNPV